MAEHAQEVSGSTHGSRSLAKTVATLEWMDNLAHIVVSGFFILMALTVIVFSVATFVHQMPLIGDAFRGIGVGEKGTSPFMEDSLILLSDILFVVIILELLKTIITYLQTRDIHAIMKEFLVVGIISSVRKILLVGAESSIAGAKGWEFVKEATGTVISIVGILLLIVGLILLQRAQPAPET